MFEIESSKKIFHANAIDVIYENKIEKSYPYVVRKTTDNGIKGYIIENKSYLNPPNTLTFAQDTFSVFYQNERYFTGNKVKILNPKFSNTNKNIMIFIVMCIQNYLQNYSWGVGSTVESISTILFQLPTKDGKIDFDFMESFISELEEERISELAAYLSASGLDNYELSSEEEEAIENLQLIQWEEKNVTGQKGIFKVKNTKNILSNEIKPNSGSVPYLCASADNNSVSTYINYKEELKDKGNCIFIGGKTFVVSYQETDFFSNDSHNLALYLKEEDKADTINQLFMATCIRKGLSHKYSWGNSISNKKIQNDKIMLPIKDGIIDYDMMNTIISAVKKLVIKDVVLYADKKIDATKKAINKSKNI